MRHKYTLLVQQKPRKPRQRAAIDQHPIASAPSEEKCGSDAEEDTSGDESSSAEEETGGDNEADIPQDITLDSIELLPRTTKICNGNIRKILGHAFTFEREPHNDNTLRVVMKIYYEPIAKKGRSRRKRNAKRLVRYIDLLYNVNRMYQSIFAPQNQPT